ncbi:Pex24p-domain-containing protein [Piedraia hortae CBS 480.64]|uniref:Pex24p-domain-containing protein n=1 Tax=Piedraia hortae CBS 480.64 TaxID=1314780 RepID=A0A6A7C8V3_9PEZI|nr:Pex24p-domain-containing protein [Piedraia hortae CBS 480.64]
MPMAAIDTPWMDGMGDKRQRRGTGDSTEPTVAAFAPNQHTASQRHSGAGVLIHQKSPLLIATPPQVTRALAYSHPFILLLNYAVGLLSWTTGDYWQSFLLLCAFWFAVLYGEEAVRWAGPLLLAVTLIMAMFLQHRSSLPHHPESQEHKTLDEILETLQTFTSRCDVLLDPLYNLVECLSFSPPTPTLLRILAVLPFWIALASPPLHIVTFKRVLLVVGTLALSWHSPPARVTRTLLWRSRMVRRTAAYLTALPVLSHEAAGQPARSTPANAKPGLRFTFSVYENQRRWVGLGWTPSLLAYEREPWTDEHHNPSASPDDFKLPETDPSTSSHWRWAPNSEWRVLKLGAGDDGWVYYDNRWHSASNHDSWTKYTRRRKWMRDAELVEGDEPQTVQSRLGTPQMQSKKRIVSGGSHSSDSGYANPDPSASVDEGVAPSLS